MTGQSPRSRPRPRPRPRVAGAVSAMSQPDGPLHNTPEEAALLRDGIRSAGMDLDTIIEKYAGRQVPLDRAFPDPPPPVSDANPLTGPERPAQAQDPYPTPAPSKGPDMAAEGAARREARLRLMQRLMMRGANLNQIAASLDMALPDVYRLRSELHRRIEAEAGNVNMLVHLGQALAFYDEVRGQMMRRMDTEGLSHVDRSRYAATALAAENSKHRFLHMAGFYKNAEVQPKQAEPEEQQEMNILGTALRAMLDPDAYAEQVGDVLDGEAMEISEPSEEDLIRVL